MDGWKRFVLTLVYGARKYLIKLFSHAFFHVNRRPSRIVIHRVGAFGDSIVALPALKAIRDHYADALIDIYSTQSVGVSLKDIADEKSIADSIYIFKKGEREKAWGQIKSGNYDLYIELPQNLNLVKSLLGILRVKFKFGIDSAYGWDAGRVKKYLHYQKKAMKPPREVNRFLNTLKKHGVTGEEKYPLAISEQDVAAADSILNEPGKSYVGFLIGGKLQAKKWPIKNWAKLAQRLSAENDVVLIGGESERSEAAEIKKKVPDVLDLCGETSLMQTAAILQKMTVVISHDTGAMHLAYAVGTPVIALFSTRELSDKWFPPQEKSKVIEKIETCSFCFKQNCENNICMQNIAVDEVVNAFHSLTGGLKKK